MAKISFKYDNYNLHLAVTNAKIVEFLDEEYPQVVFDSPITIPMN
jgi:hypothetical protein